MTINREEVNRVHKIWDNLRFPSGQAALSGSGTLALRGIDRGRPMGDMDIFTTTQAWFELYRRRPVYTVDDISHLRTLVDWRVFTTVGRDLRRMCDPPYLYAEMYGLEVNIFFGWRQRPEENGAGDIYVPHWIKAAEIVGGIPCVPIGFTINWKLSTGRSKDLTDVLAIRQHMNLPERSEA